MKHTNQELNGKPVVMLTTEQLAELVRHAVSEVLEEHAPETKHDLEVMTRAECAAFLRVSLSTLDALCRRERDPIPFTHVADSRRFHRPVVREWLLRQRGGVS